jgi:hypothetical protein
MNLVDHRWLHNRRETELGRLAGDHWDGGSEMCIPRVA